MDPSSAPSAANRCGTRVRFRRSNDLVNFVSFCQLDMANSLTYSLPVPSSRSTLTPTPTPTHGAGVLNVHLKSHGSQLNRVKVKGEVARYFCPVLTCTKHSLASYRRLSQLKVTGTTSTPRSLVLLLGCGPCHAHCMVCARMGGWMDGWIAVATGENEVSVVTPFGC